MNAINSSSSSTFIIIVVVFIVIVIVSIQCDSLVQIESAEIPEVCVLDPLALPFFSRKREGWRES